MKKTSVFLASFLLLAIVSFSQTEKTINTEEGTMVVKKDVSNNRDYLTFSNAQWDDIASGTDYTTASLTFPIHITICITIATRHSGCKSGIGFRCGLTTCANTKLNFTDGRNSDRKYNVTLSSDKGLVTVAFNEKVDWDWLQ